MLLGLRLSILEGLRDDYNDLEDDANAYSDALSAKDGIAGPGVDVDLHDGTVNYGSRGNLLADSNDATEDANELSSVLASVDTIDVDASLDAGQQTAPPSIRTSYLMQLLFLQRLLLMLR